MKRSRLCLISLVLLAVLSVAVGWNGEKSSGSGLSEKVVSSRLEGRFLTRAKNKLGKGREKRRGIKMRKNRQDKKKNYQGEKRTKKIRRGRKGRKRSKNGMRGRKGRKNGMRGRKRRNNRKKNPSKQRKPEGSVPEECFTQAVTILKMWKDSITNYERKTQRMERRNNIGEAKLMKRGEFIGVAMTLLRLGGGDKTNLACAGSRDNAGAKQLSNLTKTLHACQSDISRSLVHSHWSRNVEARLSLVESNGAPAFLCHKEPGALERKIFCLLLAGSLWQKG